MAKLRTEPMAARNIRRVTTHQMKDLCELASLPMPTRAPK